MLAALLLLDWRRRWKIRESSQSSCALALLWFYILSPSPSLSSCSGYSLHRSPPSSWVAPAQQGRDSLGRDGPSPRERPQKFGACRPSSAFLAFHSFASFASSPSSSSIFIVLLTPIPRTHPFARDADALYQLGLTLPPLAPPLRAPARTRASHIGAGGRRAFSFRPFDLLTPAPVHRLPSSPLLSSLRLRLLLTLPLSPLCASLMPMRPATSPIGLRSSQPTTDAR
ncbi:hypothetical protein B0H13DRAFT_2477474 [Mycena leptocephala]|nr:hypothetical protein B0H13DRAFT_2477474 [Mycena leptocephala]